MKQVTGIEWYKGLSYEEYNALDTIIEYIVNYDHDYFLGGVCIANETTRKMMDSFVDGFFFAFEAMGIKVQIASDEEGLEGSFVENDYYGWLTINGLSLIEDGKRVVY